MGSSEAEPGRGERDGRIRDETFSARIQKSPNKGGWTYIALPDWAAFFGTADLDNVRGLLTVFSSGARSWPWETARTSCIKADVAKAIGRVG